MPTATTAPQNNLPKMARSPFDYIIAIAPLGFLYGSAGRFLSPENLVGRSGANFPPHATTLSGLFAAHFTEEAELDRDQLKAKLDPLQLAGPFWAWNQTPQNFFVPTPFNCLVKMNPAPEEKLEIKTGKIVEKLFWHGDKKQWLNQAQGTPVGKFSKGTWIGIKDWDRMAIATTVYSEPWQYNPHLHPRLELDQRRVDTTLERGSLFLENAVQLHPDACLIYLSNTKITDGWYRFGGEGHLVEVRCLSLAETTTNLLAQPVGKSFALITPAIWGSNRLSTRFPEAWEWETLIAERPIPFRYRRGGEGKTKRLSRGRYAVPAGTVYILKKARASWQTWPKEWFPEEGYFFKRWGCGLALPLPVEAGEKSNGL